MLKKQRSLWLTDSCWKKFRALAEEQGFRGKGALERLVELLTTPEINVFFVRGNAKLSISSE